MTTADLCAEWKRLFEAAWAEPFTVTHDGMYPRVAELMNWQRDHMAKIIEALDRPFPVLYSGMSPANGPRTVPWSWVERCAGAQAELNHSQTLEVLAARGGLDPSELWLAAHGRPLRFKEITREDALAWLQSAPWNPLCTVCGEPPKHPICGVHRYGEGKSEVMA